MASVAEAADDTPVWWQRLTRFGRRDDPGDNVSGLIRSYADGLFISARGLSKEDGDEFDRIADAALIQAKAHHPELRHVLSIELMLVKLLTPQDRIRRYWEYRERFERVATASELASYLASNPPAHPEPDAKSDPALDADMLVLLDHIHNSYLLTVVREGAVRDLKKWVQRGLMRGGLIFLGLIVLLLLGHDQRVLPEGLRIPGSIVAFSIGVITLFYLGRLGAAMSVIQRLQRAVREIDRDPFFEITALCTGRRGISIAMLSGGIFALLLYVVFAAGLGERLGMSGGIFPQVGEESPASVSTDTAEDDDGTSEDPGRARAAEESPAEPAPAGADNMAVATLPGGEAEEEAPEAPSVAAAQLQPATRPAVARAPKDNEGSGDAITSDCRGKTDCMPVWIAEIGKHLGFRSYPDFFKMLLLAFLAGFAERLVPDAIDRLTRRQGTSALDAAASAQAGDRT